MSYTDLLYPERIMQIYGAEENIQGGYDWQARYDGIGSWTRYWGGCVGVHVDCSEFDITVHRSEQNPFRVTVFKFDNDVELVAYLHYDPNNDYYICNGGLEYNNEHIELEGSRQWNAVLGGATTVFLNTNGLDFYFISIYYPDVPIENVTPVRGFMFSVFTKRGDGGFYINQNTPDNTNNTIDLNTIRGMEEHDITVEQGWFNFFQITDADVFEQSMTKAGKGTTKVFTTEDTPEDDPSRPGGGSGNYDPKSDPIDFPDLPTGGALETGVIKGYIVGNASLQLFQQKIWDMNAWDLATQFQKLVSNPLDALISLHCLPLLPSGSAVEHIKLANFDTLATGIRINSEYAIVDCGELSIKEYYGSALDYSPYTKVSVYLPFCGIHDLAIADIENATIAIKYYVDVLSGDCIAMVKCGKSILYDFKGNCKQQVPVTQATNNAVLNGMMGTGAIAVGAITGNAGVLAGATLTSAHSVASSKEKVTRSGELGGNAGFLGNFKPYLIFHRPKQSLANNFKMFKGYPSNITYNLSSLSGYTEVEYIELNGIGATDTEMEELRQILSDGVIL